MAYYTCIVYVEDMQEMRRQLKSLEEKNVLYMQQNLDLEDVSCVTYVLFITTTLRYNPLYHFRN